MSLKLSVIICTHNRARTLVGAIESLDNQEGISPGEYEIVVVDDGSTDDTRAQVLKMKETTKTTLKYIYKDWGGRAEARNLGIEKASGEIAVFVDDDVLAPPHFLQAHLKEYESGEKIVARGPIVNVNEYRIIPNFKPKMYHLSGAFFCTCNASARRKTLLEIGGFDPDFKEYGFEDNEIGWRLRQAGYKVRFSMQAYIFHYKPDEGREKQDSLKELKKRAEEMGRSAAIYYRKHPHWKVRMAIGYHPLNYNFTKLISNKWMAETAEKWIESGKADDNSLLHIFLTRRIFEYYYLRSLQGALKESC